MHDLTLTQLNIYPIKSCARIALERARLTPWGLEHDRSWMVVDTKGMFLTQRQQPRLALIQPQITSTALHVSAPQMPPLELPLAASDYAGSDASQVQVWRDLLPAFDAGEHAARWFTQFLEQPVRLVRFDPQVPRVVDRTWTGELQAVTQFSDGFPLLLLSEASLQDLNARLLQRERAVVPMTRFRPNLVVSGCTAFEEDHVDRVEFLDTQVALKLVKPCKRCITTTVDQDTGLRDARWPSEPLETLLGYRMHEQLRGAAFGQNALLVAGAGAMLEIGQRAQCFAR
jgi:uncharacterized protein YcbX